MWRGAIVTPAFGDNQACFLGAVGKDGNVLVNIGTGSQVSVYSSQNFCLDEIESRPYIGKSYLLCGASLCGGYSYEICKNFIAEILEKYGVFDVKDFYSVMNQIAEETYKEKKQKCEKVIIETTFNGTRADGTRKGKILNLTEQNNRIIIINKFDLPQILDINEFVDKEENILSLSAKNETNLESLQEAVYKSVNRFVSDENDVIISNERHLDCLSRISNILKEAVYELKNGITLDAITILIQESIDILNEFTGENASEEIVERIFSKFCVGK